MTSTRYLGRVTGLAAALAVGAGLASALAGSPLAHADEYDIEPVGSGTVVSDSGIPDLFAEGQVTQEIAVYDVTAGGVATGPEAGSLDVTENIFTSPLGSVAFIDGADATDGTGVLATDVGDPSAYDLVFGSPFGGIEEFGNIGLDQFDYSALTSAVGAAAADDFGLSGLATDSLAPGLDSLLNLF
jgi:hypothetical protein